MGRGLVRNFHTRCLYQKTHSLAARSLVRFLIHHQLVRKSRTRALPRP